MICEAEAEARGRAFAPIRNGGPGRGGPEPQGWPGAAPGGWPPGARGRGGGRADGGGRGVPGAPGREAAAEMRRLRAQGHRASCPRGRAERRHPGARGAPGRTRACLVRARGGLARGGRGEMPARVCRAAPHAGCRRAGMRRGRGPKGAGGPRARARSDSGTAAGGPSRTRAAPRASRPALARLMRPRAGVRRASPGGSRAITAGPHPSRPAGWGARFCASGPWSRRRGGAEFGEAARPGTRHAPARIGRPRAGGRQGRLRGELRRGLRGPAGAPRGLRARGDPHELRRGLRGPACGPHRGTARGPPAGRVGGMLRPSRPADPAAWPIKRHDRGGGRTPPSRGGEAPARALPRNAPPSGAGVVADRQAGERHRPAGGGPRLLGLHTCAAACQSFNGIKRRVAACSKTSPKRGPTTECHFIEPKQTARQRLEGTGPRVRTPLVYQDV